MLIYLIVDLLTVILSAIIIIDKKTFSFYHPGFILLAFHLFSNTFRFFSVMNGAFASFSEYSTIEGAKDEELRRALLLADVVLFSCSCAIYMAQSLPMAKLSRQSKFLLNEKILRRILLVTIPLGIYGALTQLYIPSFENNLQNLEGSAGFALASITASWLGLSLLALIYFYGFKAKYLLPLLAYLIIVAIQGYNRYRFVIPCLFLMITYLLHYHRNWPKLLHMLLLVVILLLTFPLKEIGRAIQKGQSFTSLSQTLTQSFQTVSRGNSGDQSFLDQYAMTLSEIDRNEKLYLGTTVVPLIYLIIPRSLWAEKPRLNQWQVDVSSRSRPFGTIGSIGTLYGESYANFRIPGMMLIPSALFFLLTRWYLKIRSYYTSNMSKFFYVLIFVCMIQVLRDGLVSLVIFPVLNSLPLFLIYLSHKFFATRQHFNREILQTHIGRNSSTAS